MKKYLFIFVLAVFCLTSCEPWKKVPEKIDSFVGNAEVSAKQYSADDWAQSKAEYQELIDLYTENKDKYTNEQKAMVVKAIGRYHALLVVNGINEAASLIQSLKDIAPAYLKGIDEVVNENTGGLKGLVQGLLQDSGLGDTIEQLGADLEDLVSGVSEEVDKAFENYNEE